MGHFCPEPNPKPYGGFPNSGAPCSQELDLSNGEAKNKQHPNQDEALHDLFSIAVHPTPWASRCRSSRTSRGCVLGHLSTGHVAVKLPVTEHVLRECTEV